MTAAEHPWIGSDHSLTLRSFLTSRLMQLWVLLLLQPLLELMVMLLMQTRLLLLLLGMLRLRMLRGMTLGRNGRGIREEALGKEIPRDCCRTLQDFLGTMGPSPSIPPSFPVLPRAEALFRKDRLGRFRDRNPTDIEFVMVCVEDRDRCRTEKS